MFLGADGEEKNLTVMLSDALYDFDILEMPNDSVSAMDVSDYSRWCMVDENIVFYDNRKPPTNLALSGIYRFSNPKIFMKLQKTILKTLKMKHNYQIY